MSTCFGIVLTYRKYNEEKTRVKFFMEFERNALFVKEVFCLWWEYSFKGKEGQQRFSARSLASIIYMFIALLMNILYFRTPFPLNFPNSEPFIILSCDIFRHHNAASIKTLLIFWPFFFYFLFFFYSTQNIRNIL